MTNENHAELRVLLLQQDIDFYAGSLENIKRVLLSSDNEHHPKLMAQYHAEESVLMALKNLQVLRDNNFSSKPAYD